MKSSLRLSFWLGVVGLATVALTVLGHHSFQGRIVSSMLKAREATRIAREARILSLDQETGLQSDLLFRQNLSLAPAASTSAVIGAKVDSLVRLTARSASDNDRALAIRSTLARWHRGYVVPALAEIADGRTTESPLKSVAGKELLDGVRAAFDSFIAAQERRYRGLARFQVVAGRMGLGLILAEIVLIVAVMTGMSRRSATQARQLLEQQELLEEQAAELEYQTDQLSEQAVSLEEHAEQMQHNADTLTALNRNLESTVTDLRLAQNTAAAAGAAREQTQSLLDFVLESSPVGFGMLDRELRYTVVNQAIADLSGMSPSDLVGKRPRELVNAAAAAEVEALLTGVLNGGGPISNAPLRGSLASDPDHERHWLVSYFLVGERTDPSRGVGIVATETTDRKRLEEQLLQAGKMEAVGRLAGGVAHDFNNMLTAIKSYAELLLGDVDPTTSQRSDLAEIVKATDRASSLTRQLLAFSRQQVLRPQSLDLNATVTGIKGILRPLVGASVEIHTILDSGLSSVIADPGEIERVIMNLSINARDAMPHGGKLSIQTSNVYLDSNYAQEHADVSPGHYVMLAVTDTGEGMTKEVRKRLFEPFFTTKEPGKGTGLGLSSSYGIVRQSGGHIWAYSEPGRGTTFKIYLPRADAGTDAMLEEAGVPVVDGFSHGGETVLLVEDDEAVRVVTARILRRAGYVVLEASNGIEALGIFRENGAGLDMIITDIVMPEMDGAELSSRIRAECPGARVLFTSGYTEDSAIRKSILEPGADFLEKPFSLENLSRMVRRVLDSPPVGVGV